MAIINAHVSLLPIGLSHGHPLYMGNSLSTHLWVTFCRLITVDVDGREADLTEEERRRMMVV